MLAASTPSSLQATRVSRKCVCSSGVSAQVGSHSAPTVQRPLLRSRSTLSSSHSRSLQLLRHDRSSSGLSRQQHLYRQPIRALFTGIVQGKASIRSVRKQENFSSLLVAFPDGATDGIQIGASVAINGTCLTVTAITEAKGRPLLAFDVIGETLRATNLGELAYGSSVNFERSARMGDEVGGHHVSGHVHTTAHVAAIEDTENNRKLTFQVPERWTKYILPKGFIAVDGCSLTVGEVTADGFSVYLIPETLRATILGQRQIGCTVNVEIDAQTQAIVDTVESVVARYMAENLPKARMQLV